MNLYLNCFVTSSNIFSAFFEPSTSSTKTTTDIRNVLNPFLESRDLKTDIMSLENSTYINEKVKCMSKKLYSSTDVANGNETKLGEASLFEQPEGTLPKAYNKGLLHP